MESSFLPPYDIQIRNDQYSFVTDNGVEYIMTFFDLSPVFIIDGKPGEDILFEFSFGPANSHTKGRFDPRIKKTISSFLINFATENPSVGISYVCDSSDRRMVARSRLFTKWFIQYNHEHGNIYHKENFTHHSDSRYHLSLIIRKDHEYYPVILDSLRVQVNELISEKLDLENSPDQD